MPRAENQVNVRLTKILLRAVDQAIAMGAANNRSDFVRAALVDRLQQLRVFEEILAGKAAKRQVRARPGPHWPS